MAFHRIKKYSRQVVCHDMVLSCQLSNIEEIPLFKRAGVTAISLKNQGGGSVGERSSWLGRDSDLSGMLVSWHLWSSRDVPFSIRPSRIERTRGTVEKHENKMCHSSLTLRNQSLYMSIEKYLLFLMPRELTRNRVIRVLGQSYSRQERIRFSAPYVDTALGLRQYQFEAAHTSKRIPLSSTATAVEASSTCSLSAQRMRFSHMESERIEDPTTSQFTRVATDLVWDKRRTSPYPSRERYNFFPNSKNGHVTNCTHRSLRPILSLHCTSVLGSPDIQDIAQSGFITLEGSLTLELS